MIASPALGGGQVVVVRAAVAGDRAIRGDVRGRIRCSRPRGLVGMLGYGLGTNTGLKRVATADHGTSDDASPQHRGSPVKLVLQVPQ